MLIKITVKNFKSFDKENILSMVSSSKIQSHPDHKIKIKNVTLLKNSVIYGANASGKSNLVEVFHFIKWTVEKGLPMESRDFFCKNKKENRHRESEFELQFTFDRKFYAYGFKAILAEGMITEEWLYELKSQEGKMIYEFEKNQKPVLGKENIKVSEEEKLRFDIYAKDYLETDGQLFLTELNRNKKYQKDSGLIIFNEVYRWIQENLIVITPNTSSANMEYYYGNDSAERVNELMKSLDTGVSQVFLKKIDLEEMKNSLSKEMYEEIKDNIQESINAARAVKISVRGRNTFITVIVKNKEILISKLCTRHNNSEFDFNYSEESDGTKRILDLIDMIFSPKKNAIYVVDELDRSLHPKLTAHFLRVFMKEHENDNVQLIFSTHEASLMDENMFRRDEIWFVERDADNNSDIYSLDIFKERYDKRLCKAYLEGRYGAIPVFQDFEFKDGK
ncbi:MAG: ATP-binding protein [Eubacteriales bacterium]|nr:ATP-binding protein [Eubacteriales bacterium]